MAEDELLGYLKGHPFIVTVQRTCWQCYHAVRSGMITCFKLFLLSSCLQSRQGLLRLWISDTSKALYLFCIPVAWKPTQRQQWSNNGVNCHYVSHWMYSTEWQRPESLSIVSIVVSCGMFQEVTGKIPCSTSFLKPQHLADNWAFSLTEGAVSEWFSKVLATVTTVGLGELAPGELARRMWNCHESASATDHSF